MNNLELLHNVIVDGKLFYVLITIIGLFFIYLFSSLALYKYAMYKVMDWNKELGLPMSYEFGWLGMRLKPMRRRVNRSLRNPRSIPAPKRVAAPLIANPKS